MESTAHFAPAWTPEQGFDDDGTPNLTLLQRVDAIGACLAQSLWEDAFNHINKLSAQVWGEAFKEAINKARAAQEEARRLRNETQTVDSETNAALSKLERTIAELETLKENKS